MLDPTTLFTYERDIDARTLRGSTLLVTLEAYTDAGHAQALIEAHLKDALPHRLIGRLDLDQVHDYAGRRPEITLERDRFLDYAQPEILLTELTSPSDEPFFLLSGAEPSFQWERVAAAIRIIVEQLGIERIVLVQGFPAPMPHTRPLQVTAFADDPANIRAAKGLPASFRMKASFTSMLTVRLGQAGHPTVGLVAHVPQYLAEVDYPESAIALLRAFEEESGLTMPIGALAPSARTAREEIEAQTAEAPQLQQLIGALEDNYDRTVLEGGDGHASEAPAEEALPSSEELAAELDRFLRDLDDSPSSSPEGPAGSSDSADPEDGSGSDA